MEKDIQKQRGVVILSREFLLTASAELLKELFSNIFPIYVDTTHMVNYYDSIRYFCLSPYFEEVEEACKAPEYTLTFQHMEDGTDKLFQVNKVDKFYSTNIK